MFFSQWLTSRPPLTIAIEREIRDGHLCLVLSKYVYGSDYVGYLPSYFFLIKEEATGEIVGQCDLRIGDNETIPYAGHIGYRIYAPYRGKGYAQRASRILLNLAHNLGIEDILITCDPDNLPSKKTLENLEGTYHGSFMVPEGHVCYKAGDREKCRFTYKTENYKDTILI